jgi:hypothetical protein
MIQYVGRSASLKMGMLRKLLLLLLPAATRPAHSSSNTNTSQLALDTLDTYIDSKVRSLQSPGVQDPFEPFLDMCLSTCLCCWCLTSA